MKKLALILALTAAVPAAIPAAIPAHAGGPVMIEDEYDVEADKPSKNAWIVPVIIGAVVICALACGGNDDAPVAPPEEPGPVCYSQDC